MWGQEGGWAHRQSGAGGALPLFSAATPLSAVADSCVATFDPTLFQLSFPATRVSSCIVTNENILIEAHIEHPDTLSAVSRGFG